MIRVAKIRATEEQLMMVSNSITCSYYQNERYRVCAYLPTLVCFKTQKGDDMSFSVFNWSIGNHC